MNFATAAVGAINQVAGAMAPQTEQWSTKMMQCDGIPKEHWFYSIFCTPCAAAHAKSKVDQTHPVFNFFCFLPVGSYSFVRHAYNIMGECGQDCMYGWGCMFCATRQIWTEANTRGKIVGKYGQASAQWSTDLTQCDCGQFWKAALCPCLIAHEVRTLMQPKADNCFDYLCILPTSMYGQVRVTYGIASGWPMSGGCEDIIVGLFMYPCGLNRALREAAYQKTLAATSTLTQAQSKLQQAGQNAMNKIGQFGSRFTSAMK